MNTDVKFRRAMVSELEGIRDAAFRDYQALQTAIDILSQGLPDSKQEAHNTRLKEMRRVDAKGAPRKKKKPAEACFYHEGQAIPISQEGLMELVGKTKIHESNKLRDVVRVYAGDGYKEIRRRVDNVLYNLRLKGLIA